MTDWKQNYATFLQSSSEEMEDFVIQAFPLKPKKSKKPKEIDWIAVMKQMAILRQQRAEEEKRAKDIRQVPPVKFDETSLSSRIFQVLSNAKSPLHINDIIIQVEALGWKSTSQYHKYRQFQHVLSECYYLFEKVGVATYTLRMAFTDKKPDKPIEIKSKVSHADTKITTLKDLIGDIVKEYTAITPIQAHYSLFDLFGLWLSYSTVWRALQDERFVKDQNGCYNLR